MVSLSGILWGSENTYFELYLSIFTVFRPTINLRLIRPLAPNFVYTHFLTSIQAYFTFEIISRSFKAEKSQFSRIATFY